MVPPVVSRYPQAPWLALAFSLLCGIGAGIGAEQSQQPFAAGARPLTVVVDRGLVSVESQGTPLSDIVGRIAEAMHFTVDLRDPEPAPVSVKFERLPLEQALARLSANYTAVRDPKTHQIVRVILLPHGVSEAVPVSPGAAVSESAPAFEFSFDPSSIPERSR
jgi:hypothetical protein